MPNLTKKDLEKLLTAQTKEFRKEIAPLNTTLRKATALLTHLAEDSSKTKIFEKSVTASLDSHTTTLDSIYKNTET